MPVDVLGFWVPPAATYPFQLHKSLPPGVLLPAGYDKYGPSPVASTTPRPGDLLRLYYGNSTDGVDQTTDGLNESNSATLVPIDEPGSVSEPNSYRAVAVPMYEVGPIPNGAQDVVEFKHRESVHPSSGVPLVDFFKKMDTLEGTDDIVLDGLWGEELLFMIAWPGYARALTKIAIVTSNLGPLTRFDLGRKIMTEYGYFFKRVETEKRKAYGPTGFFNIALHQGLNMNSDSPGIQLTQLRLIKFRKTAGGIWVADIEIV